MPRATLSLPTQYNEAQKRAIAKQKKLFEYLARLTKREKVK